MKDYIRIAIWSTALIVGTLATKSLYNQYKDKPAEKTKSEQVSDKYKQHKKTTQTKKTGSKLENTVKDQETSYKDKEILTLKYKGIVQGIESRHDLEEAEYKRKTQHLEDSITCIKALEEQKEQMLEQMRCSPRYRSVCISVNASVGYSGSVYHPSGRPLGANGP